MSAPDLAVVYTTRDSMRTIERSLLAVRSIATRIVVVDSGSTDGTVERCKALGCEVFHRPWHGHERSGSLATQKQFGIDRIEHEGWILLLDSDEIPTPSLVESIRAAVERDDHSIDAYLLNRRHWYKGGWISAEHPDRILRLFRRGRAHMRPRLVHEVLECEGRTARLSGQLRHESWLDFSDALERALRYARASALIPEERTSIAKLLFNAPWSFFKTFLLQGGCRDGWRGVEASTALAARSLFKHLFIAERRRGDRRKRRRPGLVSTPSATLATHVDLRPEPVGSGRAG